MMFKICQMMEDCSHHEFIVKNNADESCPGHYSSHDSLGLGCCCCCIANHIEFSTYDQIGLEHVDEVEDDQG